MTLYEILDSKKRKRPSLSKREDYVFYNANKSHLSKFPRFSYFKNDEFDIMRANIVLHGYLNKCRMEQEIESMGKYIQEGKSVDHIKLINTIKEKMVDAPYFLDDKNKIYIPFFSRMLNELYSREPEKLLIEPYNELKNNFQDNIVDPFDTYGSNLYNSLFTRLLKIDTRDEVTAYFHYDTNTIYFVNDQGRLDNKLVLFDKYIKNPSFNHMLERVKPVVEAYFSSDRSRTINALYQNGFISNRILTLINKTKTRHA